MPPGNYHTGIKRDENDKLVWRRSGDKKKVKLQDWMPYRPLNKDGCDFLYWDFFNNEYINKIYNVPNQSQYFICEY